MRRVAFASLILFASFVSLVSRAVLDPQREQEMLMDMAYLPNGRMLGWISGGMDDALSDLLWLRSLRYVMDHFDEERDYTYLYKAYDIVTDLDPNFEKAYRFGSYFLSGMTDEYDNARDLLEKGWDNNPDSWGIAYDLGSVYDLHLKDSVKAAEWFARAGHHPDCPSDIARSADIIYEEEGRLDRALAMWQSIHESTEDKHLKKVSGWNVKRVRSTMIIKGLNTAVEKFKEKTGYLPKTLGDLEAAGMIRFVPKDAFDEGFLYVRKTATEGDEFEIACREVIRRELNKRMVYLRNFGLRAFKRKHGRWPESLDEMVEKETLEALPPTPYNIRFDFDAESGELSYDKSLEKYNLGVR